MEVQWLNHDGNPPPATADLTEFGGGNADFVLESWDPGDPPGGGAAGYITAIAATAAAGENDSEASWGSGFGSFYCRFEWGGPGTGPANGDYALDGISVHTAGSTAGAYGPNCWSLGWGWAGVGDPDTGSDAYVTDSTAGGWDDVNHVNTVGHYHGGLGDGEGSAYMGASVGGVLEGTYPYGGAIAEATADSYYEGSSSYSSATSDYSVSAQVVQSPP